MLTEYAGNLAHHLEFGHALEIVAKTIDAATKFYITIASAKSSIDPNATIGLRLACYFRDGIIIRNSRKDGEWGEEEITDHLTGKISPNPIISGEFFLIYILACEEKFHISINNRAFCTFAYRVPLEQLRSLEIHEQIQVIKQVDHRTVFPSPWPPTQISDYFKAFSSDVPILFSPGHVIVITARCFDNKKGQFIIKFMETDTKREELHFSVRFDQKVVVRNSMNKTFEFGQEERHGGFPFVFDQQFQLAIAITEREFLTAVDGYNFCSYAYRSTNILDRLVGFKITCINGLNIHVTAVDHIHMPDPSCTNFEKYSKYDYQCS